MNLNFEPADLRRLSEIVAEAASREIMPRFQRLTDAEVRSKTSWFDVVTEADEAMERVVTTELQRLRPGALVVGEEAAGRDPVQLDLIGTAPFCFVVDPLDGTKNFASGLPLFGAMVAVVAEGEVIAGIIHDPVTRSSTMAVRGAGAWTEDESAKRVELRVASPVPIGKMEAIVGTNFLAEPLRSTVNLNLSRLGMTNWFRCSAHEYRLAAAGHTHVLFYNKLMPWDHAAGWLIHREAGGFSAHFDGSAYLPSHRTGGLICAPNEQSWHEVHEALFSV